MERYTRDYVYFTGTRRTLERTIYLSDNKYFCKWGGSLIEIRKGRFGWVTVGAY